MSFLDRIWGYDARILHTDRAPGYDDHTPCSDECYASVVAEVIQRTSAWATSMLGA